MRKSAIVINVATVVLTFMLAGQVAAQSAEAARCSAKTLKGSWAIAVQGTAPFGPIDAIGVETFDGESRTVVRETLSFNGVAVPYEFSGTYVVNPDCTGTLNANQGDGSDHMLSIVISANGTQFYGLQVEQGTIVRVVGTKQNWPAAAAMPDRNNREPLY